MYFVAFLYNIPCHNNSFVGYLSCKPTSTKKQNVFIRKINVNKNLSESVF